MKAKASHPRRRHWSYSLARWLSAGALAVLLLLCAAFLALKALVTPEWLKSVVVTQMQRAFQRPVQVEQVNVLLHRGVQVRGLRVLESPDFPGEFLLTSENLFVTYKLRPLLQGRLELRAARLISPKIYLRRREDGVWNIRDVLVGRPGTKTFGLPILQSADQLSIDGGELRLRDRVSGRSLTVQELKLLIQDFSAQSPFPFFMSFAVSQSVGAGFLRLSVDVSGEASLAAGLREKAFVRARRLVLRSGDRALTASGEWRDLSRPAIELEGRLPRLNPHELLGAEDWPRAASLPGGRFDARVVLVSSASARAWRLERGNLSLGPLSVRAEQSPREAFARLLRARVEPFPVKSLMPYVPGLEARALGGSLEGDFELLLGSGSARVRSASVHLSTFSARLSPRQSVADVDARLRWGAPAQGLLLSIAKGRYVGSGNAFSDIRLSARLRKSDLAVSELSALWRQTRLRLRACVRNLEAPKEILLDARADQVRIDEAFAAVRQLILSRRKGLAPSPQARAWVKVFKYSIPKQVPDIRARLRVGRAYSPNFQTRDLEIACDLRGISKGLKELDGDVRVGALDGRVTDIAAVRRVHKILNLLLLPFVYMHELNAKTVMSLNTATPKTMDYHRLFCELAVANGIAGVRRLHVSGSQFLAFVDGKVDFPQERSDLRVLMRLNKPREQLPERLVDTSGRPSLELYLREDLNRPKPELTLRKLKSNDIESALEEAAARAKDFDPVRGLQQCLK